MHRVAKLLVAVVAFTAGACSRVSSSEVRLLATQALNKMLQLVIDRPIFARAATDNIRSIRVLQKCGFNIIGKNKDFANAEVKTRKNTFFAWISIKQMNELA